MIDTIDSVVKGGGGAVKLELAAELWYTVVVQDRWGKILCYAHERSRSYVRQWNQLVNVQMRQANLSIETVRMGSQTIKPDEYNLAAWGLAGGSYNGILIGTGDTAVTMADYMLESRLSNGADWTYGASSFTTPTVSGADCSFQVSRAITNLTGGAVAVKEIGIYVYAKKSITGTVECCGARDILASPFTVPDGGSITVTYTIKVTAPGFLKGWNQLIAAQMSWAAHTIKDTGGTDRSVDEDPNNFAVDADAADTNFGIIVGTGDTAVTVSDYSLESPIAEGAGAGQMNYGACWVSAPTGDMGEYYFTVQRIVTNNSGDPITVSESGIYGKMEATPYYVCLVRNVPTPVEVPDGGSVTVTYSIKVAL